MIKLKSGDEVLITKEDIKKERVLFEKGLFLFHARSVEHLLNVFRKMIIKTKIQKRNGWL